MSIPHCYRQPLGGHTNHADRHAERGIRVRSACLERRCAARLIHVHQTRRVVGTGRAIESTRHPDEGPLRIGPRHSQIVANLLPVLDPQKTVVSQRDPDRFDLGQLMSHLARPECVNDRQFDADLHPMHGIGQHQVLAHDIVGSTIVGDPALRQVERFQQTSRRLAGDAVGVPEADAVPQLMRDVLRVDARRIRGGDAAQVALEPLVRARRLHRHDYHRPLILRDADARRDDGIVGIGHEGVIAIRRCRFVLRDRQHDWMHRHRERMLAAAVRLPEVAYRIGRACQARHRRATCVEVAQRHRERPVVGGTNRKR